MIALFLLLVISAWNFPCLIARNLRSGDITSERHRRRLAIANYWTLDHIQKAIPKDVLLDDYNETLDNTILSPSDITNHDNDNDNDSDDDNDGDDLFDDENDDKGEAHTKFISVNGKILTVTIKEQDGVSDSSDHHHHSRRLTAPVVALHAPGSDDAVDGNTIDFVFDIRDDDANLRKANFYLGSSNGFRYKQRFHAHENKRYIITVGPLEPGKYKWAVRARDSDFQRSNRVVRSFSIGLTNDPMGDGPLSQDDSSSEDESSLDTRIIRRYPLEGVEVDSQTVFSWNLVNRKSDLKYMYLMLTYPSGRQGFVPVHVTESNDYQIEVTLNERGNWKYAIWLEGTHGVYLQSPWESFTVRNVRPIPPTRETCSETLGHWEDRDMNLHKAVGRLLFRFGRTNYVCTGTLVKGAHDRALIVTAGHCIVDQGYFPDDVMFIPGQDDGQTDGTDWTCQNDPYGCFFPEFGVVSRSFYTSGFRQYDFGFYVAPDEDDGPRVAPDYDSFYHEKNTYQSLVPMDISFASVPVGSRGHLFGYPLDHEGQFMYTAGKIDDSPYSSGGYYQRCSGLMDGASGGPWTTSDPSTGNIVVQTVTSWGWSNGRPGVGAPPFGSVAECVYNAANDADLDNPQYVTASC